MKTKEPITLRQLISLIESRVDWKQKVIQHFFERDSAYILSRATYEGTEQIVESALTELKSKKKVKPYKYPIIVKWTKHPKVPRFIEIVFLNTRYVTPIKGLKPWGGNRAIPVGHYNCNALKHIEYLGFQFANWSEIIDTKITVGPRIQLWEALAEILLELTWNGLTEIDCIKNNMKLEKRLSDSVNKIKSGNCKMFTLEEMREKFKKLV